MAVQPTIPYETLVTLVEQLSPEEQHDLLHRLQEHARQQALTDEEWQAAFQSLMIDRPLAGPILLRRDEWYDDDGR
ncbi:MAG: DUF5958 family protein [Chloroflexota bacterium]|nr:DUF5958 family protein [Chloroflexota bacterium]